MGRKIWLFLTSIICVFQIISGQENRILILIDPGHGGIDSGAVSDLGLEEKDVVLDIANYILYWNKVLFEDKYDFYLTRSSDTLISLGDRTKLAKYLKPDIFISLHCNHIKDSRIKGVELYTYDNNDLALMHANAISNEFNQKLGFKTRVVNQANFQVLRETFKSCPAILLELGYLSNKNESDYMSNKEKRKALALAILMAI